MKEKESVVEEVVVDVEREELGEIEVIVESVGLDEASVELGEVGGEGGAV